MYASYAINVCSIASSAVVRNLIYIHENNIVLEHSVVLRSNEIASECYVAMGLLVSTTQ